MSQPSVFVTRRIAPEALEKLAQVCQVEVWQEETPPSAQTLAEKAAHAQGLLTLLTDPMNADLIHQSPELKVISQMAVGYDNIDIAAATQAGIPVGHTPGILTETTADFTWALLMAAARRVVEAHQEVQKGIWRPWGPDVLTGVDLYGATLGIVGFGRIGQAVARRAAGFDMQVLYSDPHCDPEEEKRTGARCVTLDELLRQSDFVTLHTYLSPETFHLISTDQLKKMKPSAILINTSRGPVVDSQALDQALQDGIIAGAALDVTEPEPIPQDSPLLRRPNVVVTPHIASASKATRRRMAEMAVENLIAGVTDQRLPHCANPDVYTQKKFSN